MRVFISYTAEDLKDYADVVQDVVRRLEWIAVDHRDWAPDGRPSVATCKQRVMSCDIVVVIVAHRYGWIPPKDQGGDGETSITWMEYKWAREFAKPVVPYVLDDKAKWPDKLREIQTNPDVGARLEAFKAELRKGSAGFFTDDHNSLLEKLQSGLMAAALLIGGSGPERNNAMSAVRTGNSVLPAKLPYRCDRVAQASLLKFAVKEHAKSGVRRPLICVVHGRSDEAHQAFVERVENDTVAAAPPGSDYRFTYLSKTQPAQIESLPIQVRGELAEHWSVTECEDEATLLDSLKNKGIPIGLFCMMPLRTSECGSRVAQVLEGIHRYWREFPDLPPALLVVCIVCLKFDVRDAGMFERVRRMLGAQSVETQASKAIAALEAAGRDDPRAPLYVLPRLKSVHVADIDRWLTEARDWLSRHVPDEQIKAALGGRDEAPMDTVITFLEGLIRPT